MQERKEAISPTKNFSNNRVLERKFKGDNDTEMIILFILHQSMLGGARGKEVSLKYLPVTEGGDYMYIVVVFCINYHMRKR